MNCIEIKRNEINCTVRETDEKKKEIRKKIIKHL